MNCKNQQQPTGDEVTFRTYKKNDYPAVKKLMQTAFADMGAPYVLENEMNLLAELYPKGQILAIHEGEIIGVVLSRITTYAAFLQQHTVDDCSNVSVFVPEMQTGEAVYGMDVFTNPQFGNLRIGKRIVLQLLKRVFEDNFPVFVGTSRVTNYHQHIHEMDCMTYVEKVKNRELRDPVLCFHLSYGMQPTHFTPHFAPDDALSMGHGVHIEMKNPHYDPKKPIYAARNCYNAKPTANTTPINECLRNAS